MDWANNYPRRWNRWHSDDWRGLVVVDDQGHYFYNAWQGPIEEVLLAAPSLPAAQHAAEQMVQKSGHRCTARCSFWIPDPHLD